MEDSPKVFELPTGPRKEAFEAQLLKALIDGARESIHSKNPDGSNGGLERFMAHAANLDPVRYMKILMKLGVEHET